MISGSSLAEGLTEQEGEIRDATAMFHQIILLYTKAFLFIK